MDFDDLAVGATVRWQLTRFGVTLRGLDGSPVRVVDSSATPGLRPQSGTQAAELTVNGVPLAIRINPPRHQVGLWLARSGLTGKATLRAYTASEEVVGEVSVDLDPSSTANAYLGLAAKDAVISRVLVELANGGALDIDDLQLVDGIDQVPSVTEAVGAARSILTQPGSSPEAIQSALDSLIEVASPGASRVLQETALNAEDLRLREQAVSALIQVRNPDSIPALSEVGLSVDAGPLRQAAENAVWALRRNFPAPNPPLIEMQAVTEIREGIPFVVEVRMTSPVDRAHVQTRFRSTENMFLTTIDGAPEVYEGPLPVGKTITLRATYMCEQAGQAALPFTVRVNDSAIDAHSHTAKLYVDVQKDGGTAGMTPFPGWDEVTRHIVTPEGTEYVPPLFFTARARSGERTTRMRGSVSFNDGDPGNNLAFAQTSTKPARFVRVVIADAADTDEEYGEGWTDSTGAYNVRVEDVPDNRNLVILLEVYNSATHLYLDTDVGDEEFFHALAQVNAGVGGPIMAGHQIVGPQLTPP